jgi:hypothetical protein
MHFEYVPKPEVIGSEGRQYFLCAFWIFGQSAKAFKHHCDVLSIDDTFLTGKYEGTMLIAIGTWRVLTAEAQQCWRTYTISGVMLVGVEGRPLVSRAVSTSYT